MKDVITIGEAMVLFNPGTTGPMKFVDSFHKKVAGAELNLVIGCARLGLNTGYISRLGNDEFGKAIRTFIKGEGIDASEVLLVNGYPTSLNFKEISADGSVRTFYYRDKSPTLTMTPEELNEDYIKQARVLHLTGIFPAIGGQNRDILFQAIRLAKKHGVKVAFDPNIRLKMWSKEEARKTLLEILPHVDILLAGDEEMEIIIGEKDPAKIIEQVKGLGVPTIAIKQGEQGSVGYDKGETVISPAVKASKVVDTVGAGDGFNAGFLYGYLHDWSLERTLHFANTIGSMVVGVVGDNEGLPYYEDVQERLGEIERVER
ncbi:sugar kinase [Gracilibacillus alcaliphilus]|uniref:sugar kinase n=1 Tax=Gracilibacillus alcaliphilus TaxID=1401441 RepID=UPI0019590CCB|nr:sugar kinase [Gracilibacillus alcaliphilus]MBM7679045.1 2-dehydro-3-deoxygluconokinase [Gracilibacillus alcaliphilus]